MEFETPVIKPKGQLSDGTTYEYYKNVNKIFHRRASNL